MSSDNQEKTVISIDITKLCRGEPEVKLLLLFCDLATSGSLGDFAHHAGIPLAQLPANTTMEGYFAAFRNHYRSSPCGIEEQPALDLASWAPVVARIRQLSMEQVRAKKAGAVSVRHASASEPND